MANKEENNVVLGLSFPRKLYAAFTSVRWNDEGDMVVTEADLFHLGRVMSCVQWM